MFSIDVSRRFNKRSYINFLHFLYFKLVNCFCLWQLNILKISCNSWTNIANTKSEFQIWCRCLYASLCCYRLSEVYDTTSINLCICKDDSPVYIYFNNSSIFNFNIFVAFYFFMFNTSNKNKSSRVLPDLQMIPYYIFFLKFISLREIKRELCTLFILIIRKTLPLLSSF